MFNENRFLDITPLRNKELNERYELKQIKPIKIHGHRHMFENIDKNMETVDMMIAWGINFSIYFLNFSV